MSRGRCCLTLLLAASIFASLAVARKARAYDSPHRQGTVDSIDRPDGKIYLNVTLIGEDASPSNPELSTGTADPSHITSLTPNGKTTIVVGSAVRLVITRQNSVYSPDLGVVDQVIDKTHCVVRVDPQLLDRTWQDPSDDNNTHKVGEYLKAGATVTIYGVVN